MRRLLFLLVAACLIASGLTLIADTTQGTTATAATSCPPPASQLENESFEAPVLTTNTYQQLKDWDVPGWTTTASDQLIEIWKSGFNGVPAAAGLQFAEINATQVSTLYQEIATTPGQTLTWSLSHRGRQGVDTMHVEIGNQAGAVNYVSGTISDGNTAWGRWTGTYTVPAGQYITQFAFVADTTHGGNKSIGNFLDDISFGTPACVTATKSVYPAGPANVGDTLTYVVAVTNQGGAATEDVTITDAIPTNTTYVAGSATPTGTLSGSTLTMQPVGVSGVPGVIEAGATAYVSFQVKVGSAASNSTLHNTATVDADNGISVDTFSTNDAPTTVAAAADVQLTKKFAAGTVTSAGTVQMTFEVKNLGPSNATEVVLSDVIPASLTLPGSLPTGCTSAVSSGNTVLTCVAGNLTVNQTVTFTMTMTAATTSSQIEVFNSARISSESFDPNPINDFSTAPISIRPDNSGALKITKIAAPPATSGGSIAGWLVTVHNAGSVATNSAVTLADPGVAGFTATNVTITAADNNNLTGEPTPTCTLGATPLCTFPSGMNGGNSYVVVISGTLNANVATGTQVVNTATLSNGETANASITANNVADVVVLKNLTTSPEAGAPLGYQVTVTNAGPSVAVNTVITDTLPQGTSLVQTPSGCTVSGQTLTCQLGDMASGSNQTLFYQVSIPNVGGTFTNHVIATSSTPFLDSTTPEDSVTVTIPGLADTGSPQASALPLGIALTASGVVLTFLALRRRRVA
ncbi:DUF11 domain-containing protein [uncultured Aurantimicrobium sp.]|uniref:DUF11 domain-containing protein n=1 Tax=uncultured Aurantimicrobium sp. TaxID=1705357 RepID=UPI00260796FE|nr:DUF11 domain-containing protein [uncultured Aurantimicrobium sp.]